MKKLIVLLLLFVFTLPVKADEGMWFLMHIERLNYVDMQKMGLQLTPEEIYSINNHSLKDAIVQFGGGCTAEIISSNGLVLTNHHCGYGQIAQLSTEKNDYLTNGFWAKSYEEELKPNNLSVRFFVRMDDVSERILSLVNNAMTEDEREKVINQEIEKIQKENNENGRYTVSVRSFYSGNEYYYFVYQDYTDVRLVGTPPNSIGKFGGDTDNWEWPRHTGDFALFRIYGNKYGNPAAYSKNNVPLQVNYHLPISLKGVQEGDFTMILGYPGRTNRWMPSGGIEQNVNYAYPAWVEASKTAMDAMKKHMDANQQVKLDYASSYASIANYWKNRQGMIDALTQHKTAEAKKKQEDIFVKKIKDVLDKMNEGNEGGVSSLSGISKEGAAAISKRNVMDIINNYYDKTNIRSRNQNYLTGFLRSSRLIALPARLKSGLESYISEKGNESETHKEKMKASVKNQYKGLYMPLEKDVLIAQLELFTEKGGGRFESLSAYLKTPGNYEKTIADFVETLFAESIYTSEERMQAFIDNPTKDAFSNDPLGQLSAEIYDAYRYRSEEDKKLDNDFQKAYRMMIQGMREQNPDIKYYPDANSTLRLTYGTVRSLPLAKGKVNDAKKNYYTTLEGTVAKYNPNDDEFDMPQRLIELHNAKDYGQYADKDGHLSVNFLTDHDITGGNSGSPVLNGKGELIGIAFDGNIEAMAGDVIFDPVLQRAINVDIRYVLFIIDKFAGATHIIDELTLVR